MSSLQRYWFEFDISETDRRTYPSYSGLGRGCGVTAYSREDASLLLREKLFKDAPIPPVTRVVEGIDVSTLDKNHVLPNIGVPTWRGIWFPRI